MSRFDYQESKQIALHGFGFYALLMALMRRADNANTAKLRAAWPDVYDELYARYHAPGGILPGDVLPEDDDSMPPLFGTVDGDDVDAL